MDMAKLSSGSISSCNYFTVDDDSAANTCSKCDHNNILISFSATLPHLTERSYIRIISCLDKKPCLLFQFFLNIYNIPAKIYTFMYYTFIVNRSRHAKSDSLNIFFINILFFHLTKYRCCNIIQNRCSVILCICFNLPFFKNHTAHIKQTNFASSSPYIYTKSIFFHAFTSLNLFQFSFLFLSQSRRLPPLSGGE